MMLDRMEGNAELKTSVHQMLASRRLTHSVLLVIGVITLWCPHAAQ